MGPAAAIWLIPLAVAAFIARTIAMAVLRPRHPDAADAVSRWWAWTPVAVILIIGAALLTAVAWQLPALGIPVTIGAGVFVYRWLFSASSIGSPFRPRR